MLLVQILEDEEKLRMIAKEGALLVDEEIASKTGLRAKALKMGYKTIQSLKPGMVEQALVHLLPSFAPAIDPHYQAGVQSGDLHQFFRAHSEEIAEDLLKVTDQRAQKSSNNVLKKVYRGLRNQAHKHTSQAVPRLAGLLEKHVAC